MAWPQARCCTHHHASDPFPGPGERPRACKSVEEGAELREGGDEIGHEEGPALGREGSICHLLQQPHPSHEVRVDFGKE